MAQSVSVTFDGLFFDDIKSPSLMGIVIVTVVNIYDFILPRVENVLCGHCQDPRSGALLT